MMLSHRAMDGAIVSYLKKTSSWQNLSMDMHMHMRVEFEYTAEKPYVESILISKHLTLADHHLFLLLGNIVKPSDGFWCLRGLGWKSCGP
jgi:hypothetical protein